jgi:hypothetical protein
LASAPGGSDSIRSVSVGGDELRKFKLGNDAEHATKVKPHATRAMTRLMIGSPTQAAPRPSLQMPDSGYACDPILPPARHFALLKIPEVWR